MFTGLVEELGEVAAVEQVADISRITIRSSVVNSDSSLGDSIAVNGVCLTVTDVSPETFAVDVVPETLARTSLNRLETGRLVNLERALAANGRFGGHIVQGHIDDTAVFLSRDPDGLAHFAFSPDLARYVVEKGSIAVDGVSLTVASVSTEEFATALVPTTLRATTLGRIEPGNRVNLEVDVLAKYVEKLTVSLGGDPGHSIADNTGGEEKA